MLTLDLRYNVDVILNISKLSAFRKAFDLMLIVGTSSIIDTTERIRTYYSAAEMRADGWVGTEPEYIAASLAFGQPIPPNRISIGRWDDEVGGISACTVHTAGTGYAVDDVLTVVQAGGSLATLKVTAITGGGATGPVDTVEILTAGSGYTAATGLATTVAPSGGTGCKISITVLTETAVEAAAACRAVNSEWYALIVCGLKSDVATIQALAAWAESATPSTLYAFNTDQESVKTNVDTDIFSVLKALGYKQTFGQYSTYAAQPDCVAGIIGYAMGQMTGGLRNSAYTLNFKSITGLVTETLTASQFGYISGKNGNVYVNRGEFYNWLQNGTMIDGSYFDERIYLDKLANDIQLNVADLFNQVPKVPQTEAGVNMIVATINTAMEQAVRVGFVAPGKWLGQAILNLAYGDTLPKGYLVQSEKIADQAKADRDARKSPPIYVAAKLAGAIHSVVIRVDVDR